MKKKIILMIGLVMIVLVSTFGISQIIEGNDTETRCIENCDLIEDVKAEVYEYYVDGNGYYHVKGGIHGFYDTEILCHKDNFPTQCRQLLSDEVYKYWNETYRYLEKKVRIVTVNDTFTNTDVDFKEGRTR